MPSFLFYKFIKPDITKLIRTPFCDCLIVADKTHSSFFHNSAGSRVINTVCCCNFCKAVTKQLINHRFVCFGSITFVPMFFRKHITDLGSFIIVSNSNNINCTYRLVVSFFGYCPAIFKTGGSFFKIHIQKPNRGI